MKYAIIIFVRNPELGRVKTRIAKDIGVHQALLIYKSLLQHTHDITCVLNCDKFIYYSDYINENDLWENDLYNKRVQEGIDLGERMMTAFKDIFEMGYSRVVIIGSDCPGLSGAIIEEAFQKIEPGTVVIGPSADGGYYLLGTAHLITEVFQNKSWSTNTVLTETIHDLEVLYTQYFLLQELTDIDTVRDLGHLVSIGWRLDYGRRFTLLSE